MSAPEVEDDPYDVVFEASGGELVAIDLAAHYSARIRDTDHAAAALIGEQLASRLAARMQTYCGRPLFGESSPNAHVARLAGNFSAVSKFAIGKVAQPAVLFVTLAAIDRVIAALFGDPPLDAGADQHRERTRVTQVDRNVHDKINAAFDASLREFLAAHGVFDCALIDSGVELHQVEWPALGDGYIAVPFAANDTQWGAEILLMLPRQAAPHVTRTSPRPAVNAADWRRNLRAALVDVELQVTCLVAEPEVPLARLLRLSVGDVLPLEHHGGVRVDIAGVPVAAAQPGEQDGRRAVQITTFIRGENPPRKS